MVCKAADTGLLSHIDVVHRFQFKSKVPQEALKTDSSDVNEMTLTQIPSFSVDLPPTAAAFCIRV